MLCTDSLEDLRGHPSLDSEQRIPAQNIHIVHLDQLIAEFFVLDRGLRVTLFPQNTRTFSENNNAGVVHLCRFCRCLNEIAEATYKQCRIEHVLYHEWRDRVSCVHCDISALLNSRAQVQSGGLQSWKKVLPMRSGRDNYSRTP